MQDPCQPLPVVLTQLFDIGGALSELVTDYLTAREKQRFVFLWSPAYIATM
jgi:hypothetical protein